VRRLWGGERVTMWRPTEAHPFPSADTDADPEAERFALAPEEIAPPKIAPKDGFDYWVRYVKYRVEHGWDAVIVITGEEGSGKSTLGLRFAFALDKRWDPHNLCYDGWDVLEAYERIQAGGVRGVPILYDEGVRGIMAGETMDKEQRRVVQALMLVREIGAVLIICAPDIWRVANAVRGRRAALWIHITERGVGLVHERDHRLRYRQDTKSLRLTVSPTAPELRWRPFPPSDKRWKAYVPVKTEKLRAWLMEAKKGRPRAREDEDERREARQRASNAERQRRFRQRHRQHPPEGV
jgi:hypothetical protein